MADDEEAVVLACTSLVFCALRVHVNKTEKRRHAVWVKDYLKKRETFGCYNSLLMSDLRRDFDRPNTFAVRFSLVQVGSLWSHARSKSRSVHFGSTWRLFT